MPVLLTKFFTWFSNQRELKRLLTKAKAGDLESKIKLIRVYETGRIVKKDLKQARLWLINAANAGCPDSQFQLYSIYLTIKNVTPELRQKKLYWLKKAAQQNHPEALKTLELYTTKQLLKKTVQVTQQEKTHWDDHKERTLIYALYVGIPEAEIIRAHCEPADFIAKKIKNIKSQEYVVPDGELIWQYEDDYIDYCILFNRYFDENLPTSEDISQKNIIWHSYDDQLLIDALFIGIPEYAILEAYKGQADFILDRVKTIQLNPKLSVSDEICASDEETVEIISSEHFDDYFIYAQNFDDVFDETFRQITSFYTYQYDEDPSSFYEEIHPVISAFHGKGISSVWHMTHYKNIESILKNGLSGSSHLRV